MVEPTEVVNIIESALGSPVFAIPEYPDVNAIVRPRVKDGELYFDLVGDNKDFYVVAESVEVLNDDEIIVRCTETASWRLRRLKSG